MVTLFTVVVVFLFCQSGRAATNVAGAILLNKFRVGGAAVAQQ
jgi:hypothetical protein